MAADQGRRINKPISLPYPDGSPGQFIESYNPDTGDTQYFSPTGKAFKLRGGDFFTSPGLVEIPDADIPLPKGTTTVSIPTGETTLDATYGREPTSSGVPVQSGGTKGQRAVAWDGLGNGGELGGPTPYKSLNSSGTSIESTIASGADFAQKLATGQSIATDAGLLTPRQILSHQAAQGLPVGLTAQDSLDNHRAKSLSIGAAAPSHQKSVDGYSQFASGAAADKAFAPANAAWSTAATSGAKDFRASGDSIRSAVNTASDMTSDIANLRAAAAGTLPSAAAVQQRTGISDAIAAQQAQAASARGGNLAASMRTAAGTGQQIMSRGVADAAALRANEMAAARSALTQAQGVQGQLFTGAGVAATGNANGQVSRDTSVASGRTQIGTTGLQSQQVGVAGLSASADRELTAAQVAAAREADDRSLYLNGYLQMLNGLNGNAASVVSGNTASSIAAQQAAQQREAALVGAYGTALGTVVDAYGNRK